MTRGDTDVHLAFSQWETSDLRTRRRYDECGRNGRGSRTRHGTVFGHLEVLRGLAEENSSRKVNLFEDFTGRLDIGGVLGSAETGCTSTTSNLATRSHTTTSTSK